MDLVSRWFRLKCWHQIRMDVCIITTSLRDGLRENSEGKFLSGKIFSGIFGFPLCLEINGQKYISALIYRW